ncbi:MAG TPA: SUMF1/EgtB/PvdO family nonheme iron enzyme [Myxococcota bacterium]|nr:SUMF1/EgtB/PvdO family nonheme iron enzyme [Myxococcota bacterium]
MSFTRDSKHLVIEYYKRTGYHGDTLAVFEVGSFRKVAEYESPGEVYSFLTSCADPDIIMFAEQKDLENGKTHIVYRSIEDNMEVASKEEDELSQIYGHPWCDMESNIVYIRVGKDKIAAFNGSTAEMLHEYLALDVGNYAPFEVQKEKDRLVWVDRSNELLYVYGLSDGELLSRIDVWPDNRPAPGGVDYGFLDDDHLVFGLLGQKDGVGGAYLVKVDLEALSVEGEYYMGPYDLHGLKVMEPGDGKVCAAMHDPAAACGQIWLVDTDTGEAGIGIDLCNDGGSYTDAIGAPDIDYYTFKGTNPSGAGDHFRYQYSYPDFKMVGASKYPMGSGYTQFASNIDLLVSTNAAIGYIIVYDPLRSRFIDSFYACNNMHDSFLGFDPTGNWAVVLCEGEARDGPGPPRGAGFAVADLSRYRSASFSGEVTCKKDGDCPVDKMCDGGLCKKKECLPTTCQAEGKQCGYIMDGCGDFLDCGGCPDGICIEGACTENTWVQMPGGSFMMGSETGENDEKPMHQVTVPPFEIMRTEVTNWLYCRCVNDGYCNVPQSGLGCDLQIGDSGSRPVNYLEWPQASMFCRWAGGRLPTEAEWEYAARSAGQDITYPWGDETATCQYAVMNDGGPGCGQNWAQPVCSKPAGNTAQGLCDMAGNVAEWMKDCHHGDYTGAPDDGSEWNDDSCSAYRVMRGGSYIDGSGLLRATDRSPRAVQDIGYNFQGVRCAR